MSEIIDNSKMKKAALKHMILQLHEGQAPETVRKHLARLMGQVPYGYVVEVEQELISEGLPAEEIQKLCDIHGAALKGIIDLDQAKTPPPGHPVDTFIRENRALTAKIAELRDICKASESEPDDAPALESTLRLLEHVNALMDVDKHYARKENLLFPYLEKYGITGPPKVMWGKHDEARELLKTAVDSLQQTKDGDMGTLREVIKLVIEPAMAAIEEMIFKEEQILFPMCLDTLSDAEWYDIYRQNPEIGYCLISPSHRWKPDVTEGEAPKKVQDTRVHFPSGSMSLQELVAVLKTLPFDLTFVDKNDLVRFFTQGGDRIFPRNEAVIGRKVQHCHPPSSVNVVEKILDDFKSGRHDRAPFWINLRGRFVHIEYFAVRDDDGAYLGTLEVTQDLTDLKKLEGEQRLLSYKNKE
jgi:DUF438 domain-containing protein